MSIKSALDFIAEYEGDTSDEEVPGCRVSTKRVYKDDDMPEFIQSIKHFHKDNELSGCKQSVNLSSYKEGDSNYNIKNCKKLPTPKLNINEKEKINDDPSLYDGRIRSFPHERGNWATYMYISNEINEGIRYLLDYIFKITPDDIILKEIDDFHISLTKTLIIKHHWIETFIQTIRLNVSQFFKFIILFNSINIYCNEERTRTFIGLQIQSGYDTLMKIIKCLNDALDEFKLPHFYETPSFHMSIAWCVGDYEEKLKNLLPNFNTEFDRIVNNFPQDNWYIYVEYLLCKCGNKLYQFNLL